MRLRWSKWTAVMGIIAVLMLAGGIKFLFDSQRMSREFESWQTATPMKCAVDFSKPGQFDANFNQTCSSSHGEMVALRVSPEVLKSITVTQLLAGLEATIEIRQAPGIDPVETASVKTFWQNETLDGAIPVFPISPFRKGNYQAHVFVTAGAPALAGTAQTLEARYLICGMEAMPAAIARIIGIALTVVGTIVGLVVFLRVLKRGRAETVQ